MKQALLTESEKVPTQMIEGNLEDISLPGLLQLLAAESTKNYRLRINKGGQHGDVFVCEGHLLVATFGILEGLDALSEFLNWSDGEFVVEKLPSHFKSTIRSNINLNLSDPGCFADQCAFLHESNVGLNTEIVPSRTFGTAEWQEALHVQPLEKEDYAILGWITDGRTMRQAMREFQFDLKKTIGVLYRLLITRSVEVVRPTAFNESSEQDELVKLASKALAKHSEGPPKKTLTVEFHATDIGGARARPRGVADDTASGLRALTPATAEVNAGATADSSGSVSSEKKAQSDSSTDGKPKEKEAEKPAAKVVAKSEAEPAAKEATKAETEKSSAKDGVKSVSKESEKDGAKIAAKSAAEPTAKDSSEPAGKAVPDQAGYSTGPLKALDPKALNDDGNNKSKQAVAAKTAAEPVAKDGDKNVSAQKPAPTNKLIDLLKDPVAEEQEAQAKAAAKEANLNETIANEDVEVKDNFKKQLKKSAAPVGAAVAASAKSEKDANGAKAPHQTQDLPAMPAESPLTRLSESIDEELDEQDVNELKAAEPPAVDKVLDVVSAESSPMKQFDERRTDPLPLVSIDIERLLASTFQITNIGSLALTNSQLDDLLKQVLLDAERGKTLLLVLTDSNRSESAVLASYRYCLDRGYIEHSDPVMPLTVDLLLGRLELEQYLLQRRRITGDQLRDMVAISNRQGISLDKLLVAAGYMLPIDMERVKKEKERFSPR
jgi:hypothetical protein